MENKLFQTGKKNHFQFEKLRHNCRKRSPRLKTDSLVGFLLFDPSTHSEDENLFFLLYATGNQ